MELSLKNNAHIVIKGVIKTFTDAQELKDFIDETSKNSQSLTLEFIDAYSLASSVIGFLNKKIHADNITIRLLVHQKELFELMNMLALVNVLNVSRV